MAGVKLDTVRSGVKLLSGVLKEVDNRYDGNKKLSRSELKDYIDTFGDGASLDSALDQVFKYAQKKFNTRQPTLSELNKALADAAKGAARADTDHSKTLSRAERRAMADTWQAVVDFAQDYKGSKVSDIVEPRGAP